MTKPSVTHWAMAREARHWWRPDIAARTVVGINTAVITAALTRVSLVLAVVVGALVLAATAAGAAIAAGRDARTARAAHLTTQLILCGVTWGIAASTWSPLTIVAPVLAATVVVWTVTAWWAWDRLYRPLTSAEAILRADEHSDHNHGMASVWDIGAANLDVRRDAATLRPSLEGRDLRTLAPAEWSVLQGTLGAGLGPITWTQHLRTALKHWQVLVGGPQTGKTTALACRIIDHPGAALVTSTRVDLLKTTGAMRSTRGRIVVFNPLGHDSITSTVRWSPLAGCTDLDTAVRRAGELIPSMTGEAGAWQDKAKARMGILLHVAAAAGLRCRNVAEWIERIDEPWIQTTIETLIRQHLGGSPGLLRQAREVWARNERTRDGYLMPMADALSWSLSDRAGDIGDAELDHPDFIDIADLIRSGTDTLYMVCPRDHSGITPLTNALTSEIAFQAIAVADGGRLDPPFLLALDEAFLTCPGVDLAKWSSDNGGAGIPGVITLQSLAQLSMGWGDGAADVITGNCGVVTILGGAKSDRDLTLLSKLTGSRMKTFDEDDDRPVSTLNEAAISQLPPHEALIFVNGQRPARISTPRSFARADVQAATLCTECGGSERSHRLDGINAGHDHHPRWSPRRDTDQTTTDQDDHQGDDDQAAAETSTEDETTALAGTQLEDGR